LEPDARPQGLAPRKREVETVRRSRGHSCGRLVPRIYDVSRCRFRDPPTLGRRRRLGDCSLHDWRADSECLA